MGLARSAPRIAGRLDLARGIIGRLGFRRRRGDDELAPCRGRGKHTVIGEQMHPRARDQDGELLEKVRGSKRMWVVPSQKGLRSSSRTCPSGVTESRSLAIGAPITGPADAVNSRMRCPPS